MTLSQVSLSTCDEFWKVADVGAGGGDKESALVVRMQGLPYRVSEEEIVSGSHSFTVQVVSGSAHSG